MGELTTDQLALLQVKDLQNVLFELERTGSLQLKDGELTKPMIHKLFPKFLFYICLINYHFHKINLCISLT